MQAKKECWERARRDGADRRVNELLSAAYLLVSEAYVLYGEAEGELKKYGLLLGETKHLLAAVERTMNRYFDQFKGVVAPAERGHYFEDLDAFDKAFRRWAKLGEQSAMDSRELTGATHRPIRPHQNQTNNQQPPTQKQVTMESKFIGKEVIVRCEASGVFFGVLAARDGREVRLTNCRRLWYWDGAASISQLANDGTKSPDKCKFTVTVDEIEILDAIEVIPCTPESSEIIKSVKEWKR